MKARFNNSEVAESTVERGKLHLPSQLQFTLKGEDTIIFIPSDCVCENMQTNVSAFEGWATAIYRWCGVQRIILEWEAPNNTNNCHYQRFLFRVEQFHKAYAWFEIPDKCKLLLKDLRIREGGVYVVNAAKSDRTTTVPRSKEAKLEMELYKNPDFLVKKTGAKFIERQLPVGLFENNVTTKNSIFTGKKSAVDLWGMDENGNLLLFELKAAGNKQIGIISELFFYIAFMDNVRNGKFKHPANLKFNNIQACFVAPELHQLIDDKLITILNQSSVPGVSFDKIIL